MGVVSREAIQKLSLFANVKEETVQQLVKYAKVNQYKKGSYIFRDKEMVDQVYIILSKIINNNIYNYLSSIKTSSSDIKNFI